MYNRLRRTWKAAASVCAVVILLGTIVAGAIEARVRVDGVERDLERVERRAEVVSGAVDSKLDAIRSLLEKVRVDLERLDQKVADLLYGR